MVWFVSVERRRDSSKFLCRQCAHFGSCLLILAKHNAVVESTAVLGWSLNGNRHRVKGGQRFKIQEAEFSVFEF